MLFFQIFTLVISSSLLLFNSVNGQGFGPSFPGIRQQPPSTGFEMSYQPPQPFLPQPEPSLWNALLPSARVTQNDVWYSTYNPDGTYVVQQPQGLFGSIFQAIKGFLLSFIPSPIRFLLGWY